MYIALSDASGPLRVVLMASGSEVGVALAAREQLQAEGVGARVVSFPSWALFDAQSREYKASVLPAEHWRRPVTDSPRSTVHEEQRGSATF